MTVKRARDPAGLLPDYVEVKLDGSSESADLAAFREIMNANSPGSRIDQIASAPNMADEAAALRARLGPNGFADDSLKLDIAAAEHRALYERAMPNVVRDKKMQAKRDEGTKRSVVARTSKAAARKAEAVRVFRTLIATGERDADEARKKMQRDGWPEASLRRYLVDEPVIQQRRRKVHVKSETRKSPRK